MSLTVRTVGAARILQMTGEFTLGDGLVKPLDLRGRRIEDLSLALRTLVAQAPRVILLDMAGVTFLDSAALGELIAMKKRAVAAGSDIALLHPVGKVRAMIEMVSLDKVFRMFDDETAALAAFGVREV
ncbi:MAG TPA: STAS domain-containing protein [Candidatus Polarisedimenticolia bacterium]|nr:STAS domain-containing protein [Candidatus Polarisedimenticolia bacterium]